MFSRFMNRTRVSYSIRFILIILARCSFISTYSLKFTKKSVEGYRINDYENFKFTPVDSREDVKRKRCALLHGAVSTATHDSSFRAELESTAVESTAVESTAVESTAVKQTGTMIPKKKKLKADCIETKFDDLSQLPVSERFEIQGESDFASSRSGSLTVQHKFESPNFRRSERLKQQILELNELLERNVSLDLEYSESTSRTTGQKTRCFTLNIETMYINAIRGNMYSVLDPGAAMRTTVAGFGLGDEEFDAAEVGGTNDSVGTNMLSIAEHPLMKGVRATDFYKMIYEYATNLKKKNPSFEVRITREDAAYLPHELALSDWVDIYLRKYFEMVHLRQCANIFDSECSICDAYFHESGFSPAIPLSLMKVVRKGSRAVFDETSDSWFVDGVKLDLGNRNSTLFNSLGGLPKYDGPVIGEADEAQLFSSRFEQLNASKQEQERALEFINLTLEELHERMMGDDISDDSNDSSYRELWALFWERLTEEQEAYSGTISTGLMHSDRCEDSFFTDLSGAVVPDRFIFSTGVDSEFINGPVRRLLDAGDLGKYGGFWSRARVKIKDVLKGENGADSYVFRDGRFYNITLRSLIVHAYIKIVRYCTEREFEIVL